MRRGEAPKTATWLIASLLPRADRDAFIGDLIEEYAIRARSASPASAAGWYWGQVLRSAPLVLWSVVRHGGLLTIAIALAVYVGAGFVEEAAFRALIKLLGRDVAGLDVLGVIVGLATFTAGGYVATWVRPGAAPALAAIVLISVLWLMVTVTGNQSPWYGLTFLVAGPLAALAGGSLRHARHS
jgi:hypothetical protein